jgi:hypothetical protein
MGPLVDDLCGAVDPLTGVACDRPYGHDRLPFVPPMGANGILMTTYDHRSVTGGVWFNEPKGATS